MARRIKVVADNKIPFLQGVLEQSADVVYLGAHEITRESVRDADALIVRTRTRCDRELLEGTAVRFIATATIGFDHIDTAYCESKKIVWKNAEGCNSSSVQQYIAAALLKLAEVSKSELAGKTIGIVGVGHVGSKVASLCTALGMKVLLNDPPRARHEGQKDFVSLERIARDSDIITFHVPLNPEGEEKTFHLVDENFLLGLREDQMLINSSRGEVVDNDALKAVLKERKLGLCTLDVWEGEPKIDVQLMGLVRIGTPHIAGYSADGKANGTSMSVQALSRHFGLDFNDWFPGKVPLPASTLLELDCRGLTRQNVITALVQRTYDILIDDARLRLSPSSFERQRGEYPLRREFPAYTVRLLNASEDMMTLMKKFGFKTTEE